MEREKTIVLRGGDGWCARVVVSLGLELPTIKNKINRDTLLKRKKGPYDIKGISRTVLSWILDYLIDTRLNSSPSQTDYLLQLNDFDLVFLFNLIQAAHFLEINSLMDITCQTLANKVNTVITSNCDIYTLFKIEHQMQGGPSVKASKRDVDVSPSPRAPHDPDKDGILHVKSILRNRSIKTFINDLDLLHMHFSAFMAQEMGPIDSCTKRWRLSFYDCVDEINKSTSFKEWVIAIHNLEGLVENDFRLATCLSAKITRGLVKILKGSKYDPDIKYDVQRSIISIISHARFDVCEDVVENQVVPTLVEFVSNGNIEVSNKAMLALMRLAYIFPERYKVFLDKGAFDVALKVFRDFRYASKNMNSLAKFVVAVCRGYSSAQCSDDLTFKKVEKVLPILEGLLQDQTHCYGSTGLFVCYALSYLTYGMCVTLERKTLARLITLFSDYNTFHDGSALGVVGNIVRWGNLEQIMILKLDNWLLKSLPDMLCVKYNKFRKEACQIISNMAARSGTLVQELIEAGLMTRLCLLLESEKSDVRLEAAWAIFNGICGFSKVGEIDQYPESDEEIQKGEVVETTKLEYGRGVQDRLVCESNRT